jgi:hypothetical protein
VSRASRIRQTRNSAARRKRRDGVQGSDAARSARERFVFRGSNQGPSIGRSQRRGGQPFRHPVVLVSFVRAMSATTTAENNSACRSSPVSVASNAVAQSRQRITRSRPASLLIPVYAPRAPVEYSNPDAPMVKLVAPMDRAHELLALAEWAPDDVASFQLQNP